MTSELRERVGWAFPVQIAWAILAALWNVAGVLLIAQGRRAIGPTASWLTAAILLVLAVLFPYLVKRWPIAYLLLTAAAGLLGLFAAVNAFTADPALWPSEFWRYAGAVINGAGFIAAVIAVLAFFRWRASR